MSLLGTELRGLAEARSLRIRKNCKQLRCVYVILCYENYLEICSFVNPQGHGLRQSNAEHYVLETRFSYVSIV